MSLAEYREYCLDIYKDIHLGRGAIAEESSRRSTGADESARQDRKVADEFAALKRRLAESELLNKHHVDAQKRFLSSDDAKGGTTSEQTINASLESYDVQPSHTQHSPNHPTSSPNTSPNISTNTLAQLPHLRTTPAPNSHAPAPLQHGSNNDDIFRFDWVSNLRLFKPTKGRMY